MDILYTCTPEDGECGEPSRPMDLSGVDHQLLEAAYFGGGFFWDDGQMPENSVVRLILKSAIIPLDKLEDLAACEQYRLVGLRTFGVADELGVNSNPGWEVELAVAGCSDPEIDAKIAEVLRWHNAEIERIETLLPGARWASSD